MSTPAVPVPVETLQGILNAVQTAAWAKPEIATIIGVVGIVVSGFGLGFSIAAWRQAKRAAIAARAAGKTVKIQTTTVELMEAAQKLNRIQPGIRFDEARDLVNEVSRRARRYTAPFMNDTHLREPIAVLRTELKSAQAALKNVRPTDPSKENEAPQAVYYGIESNVTQLGDLISDLLGLMERETLDLGDEDAESGRSAAAISGRADSSNERGQN